MLGDAVAQQHQQCPTPDGKVDPPIQKRPSIRHSAQGWESARCGPIRLSPVGCANWSFNHDGLRGKSRVQVTHSPTRPDTSTGGSVVDFLWTLAQPGVTVPFGLCSALPSAGSVCLTLDRQEAQAFESTVSGPYGELILDGARSRAVFLPKACGPSAFGVQIGPCLHVGPHVLTKWEAVPRGLTWSYEGTFDGVEAPTIA